MAAGILNNFWIKLYNFRRKKKKKETSEAKGIKKESGDTFFYESTDIYVPIGRLCHFNSSSCTLHWRPLTHFASRNEYILIFLQSSKVVSSNLGWENDTNTQKGFLTHLSNALSHWIRLCATFRSPKSKLSGQLSDRN